MVQGFVKSAQVAEILSAGNKSGQNVILYGAGGYGKSEMSTAFLRQIGARKEQITIKSCSVGTSVDDLFGGINMKVLQEEGRIEYNLDYSIFSTPYLILEECFDAPLRVLEALKDTLTSGWVRNGSQQYQIKTKFIIVCTNRSKEELIEDASSAALMERFPLSLKVEWDSHTWADYEELIQTVFGSIPETVEVLLKYILESIKEDSGKRPPAPRTVVRMVKVFQAAGVAGIKYMDGLPNVQRAIENLNSEMAKAVKVKEFEKLISELGILKSQFGDNTPYAEIKSYLEKVDLLSTYNKWIKKEDIESIQKRMAL